MLDSTLDNVQQNFLQFTTWLICQQGVPSAHVQTIKK